MELLTKIYDNTGEYLFIVTDGENTYEFRWAKEPPEGQDLQTYLQNCKRESELLAQLEINKKTPPKEIVL